MKILPDDVLIKINEFICKKNFYLENDILESLNVKNNHELCVVINYNDTYVCSKHDDPNYFSCIKTLRYQQEHNLTPTTIHFENQTACLFAEPYKNDFGEFSHYCCGGTGIMFKGIYLGSRFLSQPGG